MLTEIESSTPTNGGNSRSSFVKHGNSITQQQLGFWNNGENAQDVKGITYRITPNRIEKQRSLHHNNTEN